MQIITILFSLQLVFTTYYAHAKKTKNKLTPEQCKISISESFDRRFDQEIRKRSQLIKKDPTNRKELLQFCHNIFRGEERFDYDLSNIRPGGQCEAFATPEQIKKLQKDKEKYLLEFSKLHDCSEYEKIRCVIRDEAKGKPLFASVADADYRCSCDMRFGSAMQPPEAECNTEKKLAQAGLFCEGASVRSCANYLAANPRATSDCDTLASTGFFNELLKNCYLRVQPKKN